MSIGEVAERAGMRASAIRYYERAGLLPEPERQSGRRTYEQDVLDRLRVIEVCKRAGFSLREIERLVSSFDGDPPVSDPWRELATRKLGELEALAEEVRGMQALLRRGLECDCLRLEDCAIFGPSS